MSHTKRSLYAGTSLAELVCFEDSLPGFRTGEVNGRESMIKDITEIGDASKIGRDYSDYTVPSRDITVEFSLVAKSTTNYHEQIENLKKILYQENLYISFEDDYEKYYVGNVSSITATPFWADMPYSSYGCTDGIITIHCSDPFKYAKTSKLITFTTEDNVLKGEFHNSGNVPCDVDFEITHTNENGFVGIAGADGVIQYGLAEEADTELAEKDETILTWDDILAADDDPTGTANAMHPNITIDGSFKTQTFAGEKWLAISSKNKSKLSGPQKTITLPADSEGNYGCLNTYHYNRFSFWANIMGETGEITIDYLDEDDKPLYGVSLCKIDTVGNSCHIAYQANGSYFKTIGFECDHNNPYMWDDGSINGAKHGHWDLARFDDKVTYYHYGYHTYTFPSLKGKKAYKIQIAMWNWAGRGLTQPDFLYYCKLGHLNVIKRKVSYWKDIVNRYQAGDVIKVVGKEAMGYKNGMTCMKDEAVGSEYFQIPVGDSEVQISQSTWSSGLEAVATIQERWL